ncbi:hypothetical protein NP233_g58 [Leucocoprinus birnbaumii]|uniref:Uncharacterized protein n=1 Tax=Leucocoprinus birnbaumii TaxID=56174 RepID=A0AAD5Z0K3_9AGAR|nr:hypothetical protein NP233_g58 [Leucocoprinus birnbaumii]
MATGTRKLAAKKKGVSQVPSPSPVAGPSSSLRELDTLVAEDNSEDVELEDPTSINKPLLPPTETTLPELPESSDSEPASDSDSDSDYPIMNTLSTTSLPHGLVYPAGVYPYIPEMSESKFTPLLFLEYQRIVEDHAAGLRHPPTNGKALLKVVKALFNQNMAISCFIASLGNTLSSKTFVEFVDLMRERFLEKDWDMKLRVEM